MAQQVAIAVVLNTVAQNEVLRRSRGADGVGLHKPHVRDGRTQRSGTTERVRNRVDAKLLERRGLVHSVPDVGFV
jgi:hypothetical protein